MYIDDEVELCELFVERFSALEVTITSFTDPKEAIESANEIKPDLIFIDLSMPALNGDQVALQLDPKIPKILVTGDCRTPTKYNFYRVMAKPFKSPEVQSILRDIINSKKAA